VIFLVVLGAVVVGFGLILLIGRYGPPVDRHSERLDAAAPEIPGDDFAEIVQELVASLGLESVFASVGTGGVVEMTLRDPKPLVGGKILLYATPVTSRGQIAAADVLGFADTVRGTPGTLKGIFIAAAGFTTEAENAAQSAPAQVELYDGPKFLDLLRDSLPIRAEEIRRYKGFSTL
jgi:restriction endonuclease